MASPRSNVLHTLVSFIPEQVLQLTFNLLLGGSQTLGRDWGRLRGGNYFRVNPTYSTEPGTYSPGGQQYKMTPPAYLTDSQLPIDNPSYVIDNYSTLSTPR